MIDGITDYELAWIVIAFSALVGALAFYLMLRRFDWPWTRTLLAVGVLAFFAIPAPVPGYDGHWAPAFVIFGFEALFQTNGAPEVSLRLLGIGIASALAAAVVVRLIYQRFAFKSSRGSMPKIEPKSSVEE